MPKREKRKKPTKDLDLQFWPQPVIPQDIRAQFRCLNFRRRMKGGSESPMRRALSKYRSRWDSYAVAAMDGDRVLGWCLITPGRTYGYMRCSFYVRESARCQGIAKALLARVLLFAGLHKVKMAFWRHDAKTDYFFRTYAPDHLDVCQIPGLFPMLDGKWPSPWRHKLVRGPKGGR